MENREDKSTSELYYEFAERSNRKIIFSEQDASINRVALHKRTFYMPNTKEELSFLIGYHDPKNITDNELFFGAFFPLQIPLEVKLIIRKKDVLDKLNPFSNKNIHKTGSDSFDSRAVITGNDSNIVTKQFTKVSVQNLVIDCFKINDVIRIGINEFNMDFVPAFKNRSHFGIFSKQQWYTDRAIIEDLFTKIEQFRKLINS